MCDGVQAELAQAATRSHRHILRKPFQSLRIPPGISFGGYPLFREEYVQGLQFLYDYVLPTIERSYAEQDEIDMPPNPYDITLRGAATNLFGGKLLDQLRREYGIPASKS